MANSPLVSIIIPVYKVEKYLDECINSVLCQTYQNLEIILIDDGSPDHCGEICDKYAKKDTRVKVIHQINSGVANARNNGLRIATGSYLFFADSDDIVIADTIELLVATAKKHQADMVCAECCYIEKNGDIVQKQKKLQTKKIMNQAEALRYFAPKEWAPWNRLIKTEIHRNIFFPPYRIYEDEAIKFQLLDHCTTIVEIPNITYMYRQRTDSITSIDSQTDRMDMFYSRNENYKYLKENHPNITELFLPNVCSAALYNLGLLVKHTNQSTRKTRITEIINFVHLCYQDIKTNPRLTLAQKVRFKLILISDWEKANCLYIRFYSFLEKIRRRE